MSRESTRLIAMVALLWALAPPVHAYLDPGAGNALIQVIVGSAALIAGLIAHRWSKLRNWFARRGSPDRTPDG